MFRLHEYVFFILKIFGRGTKIMFTGKYLPIIFESEMLAYFREIIFRSTNVAK